MTTVPDHNHVTLDEAVFHAYQELAEAVRQMRASDLTPFARNALAKLGDALETFYEHDKTDPGHASRVPCPSEQAGGRSDRCGLFAHPKRCLPGACSSKPDPTKVHLVRLRAQIWVPACATPNPVDGWSVPLAYPPNPEQVTCELCRNFL